MKKAVPLVGFKGSKIDNYEEILFAGEEMKKMMNNDMNMKKYEYIEVEEEDEYREYEEVEYIEVEEDENEEDEEI